MKAKQYLSALVAMLCLSLASFHSAAADEGAAQTFEHIRPSLAIVQSRDGQQLVTGTGFCIASNNNHSYFLTNNHVVIGNEISVRLEVDGSTYPARIVRRGDPPMDAAVIEIDKGNIAAVTLSSVLPAPGTLIAVAGYPSFHLTSDLLPSIHLGSINSVMDNGAILEHDALTDHGNSGGPLFDRDTGIVYGVNSALVQSRTSNIVNFIAFSTPYIIPLLDNARVAYIRSEGNAAVAPSNASSVVLSDTPGAFRVGYVAPDASQPGAAPLKQIIDSYIEMRAGQILGSQLIPVAAVDPSSLLQACHEQRVNALLITNYTWNGQVQGSRDHVTAAVQMGLTDCYEQFHFAGQGQKESDSAVSNPTDDYRAAITAAADQALDKLLDFVHSDPTAAVNLVRYGFAIGTGERTAGLRLEPGKLGAIVTSVAPYGTAKQAGLRYLDIITTLNGRSLAGLSQDDLNAFVQKVESGDGKYNAEVLRADGKTVVVRYQSENISWYLREATLASGASGKVTHNVQPAAVTQSVVGTYTGTTQDSKDGNGSIELTLNRENGAISGFWVTTFENSARNSSGTLSGTTNGPALSAVLKPSQPGSCTLDLTAVLQNGAISGSYAKTSCARMAQGTFQARQQRINLPDIAGIYAGSLVDGVAGAGTFTVTLSQDRSALTGTWSVTFGSDRRYNNSGEVSGVIINATTAQIYMTSSIPGGCPYSATAIVEGKTIKGTYAVQDCTYANGGSFAATRS